MADPRRPLGSALRVATVLAVAALLAGCAGSTAATPAAAVAPAGTASITPQASQGDVTANQPEATDAGPTDLPPTDVPPSPEPTPEPTVAAAAVDPCGLLTLAEARALVDGIKVPAGGPEGDPPTRCVWPTPASGSVGQVEIDVGDGAAKTLDIERQLGHDLKAVPSLGDEAWLEPDTVFFRTGDTWVAIHLVMLNDAAENDARLLTAAALVASRL